MLGSTAEMVGQETGKMGRTSWEEDQTSPRRCSLQLQCCDVIDPGQTRVSASSLPNLPNGKHCNNAWSAGLSLGAVGRWKNCEPLESVLQEKVSDL